MRLPRDVWTTTRIRPRASIPSVTYRGPPLHVGIGDGYGEGVSKRLLGVGKADLVVGEVGLSIDRIELDVQLAQYA